MGYNATSAGKYDLPNSLYLKLQKMFYGIINKVTLFLVS